MRQQLNRQRLSHGFGDLCLNSKHIGHITRITIAPQLRLIANLNELGTYANAVTAAAVAATWLSIAIGQET